MKLKLTAMAAILGLAGPALAEGELNIYNWSGYISPDLVAKFEEQAGVTVNVDSYDSEETLLAKLQQGGAGYDIAIASHAMMPILIEKGLAQNVAISSAPEYANVVDDLRNPEWDPTGEYSVPWQWGSTNFAIDTAAAAMPDSFSVLFEPSAELQGKINMFDNASDVIAQASIYLGVPLCSADAGELQKVMDLLLAQKPHVRSYSSKAGAIREQLVAGEIVASPLWSGSTMRARELRSDIQYVFPKEGILAWVDNAFVPTGAKNVDTAKAFLTFLLAAENAAMNTNYLKYQNGITGSEEFVDAALRDAPEMNPPAGVPLMFKPTCSEDVIKLQDRIWTNLLK